MKHFPLLSLTPEILAEICENLPPQDLYTLTTVCKKLRNFLWATSGCTQQIWRKSRSLLPVSKFSCSLSPPKGISEDLRNNIPEEVLSCLPNINDIKPSNFFENCLVTLPGPGIRDQNPYYWTTDVYKACREYNELNANERKKWVEKRKAEVEEFNRSIEEIKSKDMTEVLRSLIEGFMP
ncbi:15950_t:CDS:2 [Racocetra fulgida]|uniref:15950_t:CDS:1 n=1 Tax=Racocetra fulgida TaxID=60492 RepID=A0A9N9HTS4_9GLOM|nr:15950_t:CDS:2 [Racocetra fulgida]